MCRQSSLSKYQKHIVKELTNLIGVTIPFTYEKAKNNHLKVLIDGIEKPMFTGSTPSDRNSAKNFIAQVKRALKDLNMDKEDEQPIATNRASHYQSFQLKEADKIIECCIKSLRTRKDFLCEKEREYMLEQRDLDLLHPYRSEVVKLTVEHAMKQRKQAGYFRPKQLKVLEQSVKKHFDFAMPTKADYYDLLATHQIANDDLPITLKSAELDETDKDVSNVVTLETANQSAVVEELLDSVQSGSNDVGRTEHSNTAQQLMSFAKGKRVELLRELSHDHLTQLIADIEQAKELNIRRAITEIKQLVKANDVPVERLIDELNVV